jgi:hypothetical protein
MTEFMGFVCKSCGAKAYPRHARCPVCAKTDFDQVPLEGKATLLTFTRVHMLSLAYMERYITLGIVEFDNGFRALGRLHVAEPKIGMKLTAETGAVRSEDLETVEGLWFR